MKNILRVLKKYRFFLVVFYLCNVSFDTAVLYIGSHYNLLYNDALSRLNISRRVIDSLTPGITQLGNVWLPLPQIITLPFVWNNFLWHSGIAGALMSMTAFVLGGIFLYKLVSLIHNSFFASLFSIFVYSLNINLFYLQTTAMSESIFIGSLLAAAYYFVLWIKTNDNMILIFAGIAVTAMTLIRYEGLAFLFASIPVVYLYVAYKSKNFKKAESATLLYGMLAVFGFGLWTIYLTVIFRDPLYWLHFYAGEGSIVNGSAPIHHKTYLEAIWHYLTAVVWMNGVIPTVLSILAVPLVVYRSIRSKTFYFIPLVLLGMLFVFMVLTIHKNTPIDQPALTIKSLFSSEVSKFPEFNIRYGILMLPLIAILCSYLATSRVFLVNLILVFLIGFQVFTYFKPVYSLIFQIPINISGFNTQGSAKNKAMVAWLQENYDYGLIMIGTVPHDPQMFQLGYDYKTYIHEGTGDYWRISIKNPRKYARWVVFDIYEPDDKVAKYLSKSKVLEDSYSLVYNRDGIKIYKIKGKTEIAI